MVPSVVVVGCFGSGLDFALVWDCTFYWAIYKAGVALRSRLCIADFRYRFIAIPTAWLEGMGELGLWMFLFRSGVGLEV